MTQDASTQAIRLGMVAWHALPAIVPRAGSSVGGLETGAWTLARGLRKFTSIGPAFFVRTTTLRNVSVVDEVPLFYDRQLLANIRRDFSDAISLGPPLRVHRLSTRLLWQIPLLALARLGRKIPLPHPTQPDPRLLCAKVDAWAGFGVNADSARVVATAMTLGKPSLLFLESNADLDPRLAAETDFINAYGESSAVQRFALRHASHVICQSDFQQQQLSRLFGIEGTLIRNPIDPHQWQTPHPVDRRYVLWIGRYDTFHKRPGLAIEVAKRLPTIPFRMIINPHDLEVERQISQSIPANIEIVPYVPFNQMPLEFAAARLFLCTGNPAHEGFPNVLLQAAATHTPICSLVDFDHFLERCGAGYSSCDSLDTLSQRVQQLWQNGSDNHPAPIDWVQVDDYLQKHHSLRATANAVAEIVLKTV